MDGCISQDSDCFGYGAQVVYRNFSISTQGSAAASGGAVDVYDISSAQSGLGLFVFLKFRTKSYVLLEFYRNWKK